MDGEETERKHQLLLLTSNSNTDVVSREGNNASQRSTLLSSTTIYYTLQYTRDNMQYFATLSSICKECVEIVKEISKKNRQTEGIGDFFIYRMKKMQ